VQQKIQEISSFKPNVKALSPSNGKVEKMFIDDALTTNTEELAVMQYAVTRVQNGNLKALIQFMIDQHSEDQPVLQQLQLKLNKKNGADTTNASVFPNTGDYLLGIRTENLDAKYLNRLQSAGTGAAFDRAALDILLSLHHEDIQSEVAAVNMIKSKAMKAFAVNSTKTTQLHISLMEALEDQLVVGIPADVSWVQL
jgi:hypothetical protein